MEHLPEQFWEGVQQFNQGQFYACHDTLEALWMEASEPSKSFYQGILQLAVACYHLENENWRGTVILLGEGLAKLRNYQPDYGSVDVAQLICSSFELLSALQQAGPEAVGDFSQQLRAAQPSRTLQVQRLA
ncbi:DUF309 domain-containing protein [Synechococcales cyanobacterium C]|uniref:DUF309 domain-containing protein n=2 Tax=Petrachloros TaxID=2918834 RepID=A0A8K2A839_9CYAN|nr:DUF309 domain-containing protein [Petrachloros mirabilis]NCJ06590.1 DUF309 domain-containing protein [Petrachloros mirabilis ULC683]